MSATTIPSHAPRTRAWLGLLIISTLAACSKKPPTPPQPYLAFVTNSLSNTVAAVDLRESRIVGTITIPKPTEVVVRPGRKQVWAVSTRGFLSAIAYPELRVVKTVAVGSSVASLIFSSDGREAYVLDPARGDLVFLDAETGKESGRVDLKEGIKFLGLTPDGRTLVASETAADRVAFVDVRSRKLLGTAETGKAPGPLAILPNSSQAFVADTGEKKISVVDVGERKLLANLETGYAPMGLVLKPDGGELFALSAESTLVILDTFHDEVEQNATIGVGAAAALIAPRSGVLYITTAGDGNVMALDIATRQVLASTHIGTSPTALAMTPDEKFLVVADTGVSSLAILRADPASLVSTVPVGAGPTSIVIPDWLRQE
jgi:DNA-binding beta-propeller fold protein YncE